jgi:HEAT repeat protein
VKQALSRNPQLRAQLKSQFRQRAAALNLGSGDSRKLVAMCRDQQRSEDERCEAADLLGLLGLVGSLKRARRLEVAHALLKNIGEDKFKLAWCSAVSLGYLGIPATVRPLINFVQAPLHSETRRAAIHTLGSMFEPRAAPALIDVLRDEKQPTKLRAEAAAALATCGCRSKLAIAALADALGDRSIRVRHASAFALGQCARSGGPVPGQVVGRLRQLLKDRQVLSGFGSVAKEALEAIRAARAADRHRRSRVAHP